MASDQDGARAVDAYIGAFPEDIRRALGEVRAAIRAAAPEAVEGISYKIPAFAHDGRYFVYYAANKKHIGLHPAPTGIAAFEADVAAYGSGKGTLRFPYGRPMPLDVIRRVAQYRLAEAMDRPRPARAAGGIGRGTAGGAAGP